MIWNQWYAILESHEVPRGKLVGVTRLGEKLCIYRSRDNKIACLFDACAHRGASLAAGRLCGDQNDRVECPFHGLQYDTTGRCTIIPANGMRAPVPETFRVHAHPAQEAHDFIWIWWGDPRPELPPIPFFDDIDKSFSYRTFVDPWPVHYSRAIENQLDVVHLPFVHKNTIGRGNATLVDGPGVEPANPTHEFFVYYLNRKDDGEPPIKPQDVHLPERPSFFLQFKFPHVWQNHLAEKVRILVAFVPVDEANSLLYMRFYQKFLRVPGLRAIINILGMWFSKVILRQDKRVVVTQEPKKSSLHMGEKLIQGDWPLVIYRRRRQQLQEENPVPGKRAEKNI